MGMPPPTPIGRRHRSCSVPTDVCSSLGDAGVTVADAGASKQQCSSGRWSPRTCRSFVSAAAISPRQDDGLGLHPRISPQLGREGQTLGLEVDFFPNKEMVSQNLSFDLQPTFLSAQAEHLGITIQNTFVPTAPVLLAASSNRGNRSSSAPAKVGCTAANGCCIRDQAWPLNLVSPVGKTTAPSGCDATCQAEKEQAMAVKDHATTASAICDGAAATKADVDAPRAPTQRRMVRRVRSAKLLELMPPCCRTLFHSTTVPESTLKAA